MSILRQGIMIYLKKQLATTALTLMTVLGVAACLGSSVTPTPIQPTRALEPASIQATPFLCKAALIEQSFEHGFMFWIGRSASEKCAESHAFARNSGEVWVAFANESSPDGKWLIFIDNWDSSAEPESDPSLSPPEDFFQPVRGFGKVWRTGLSDTDRLALGWATGAELPFSADYRYESAGFLNASGEFVSRPGKHIINGLAGDTFTFDEVSQTAHYELPTP